MTDQDPEPVEDPDSGDRRPPPKGRTSCLEWIIVLFLLFILTALFIPGTVGHGCSGGRRSHAVAAKAMIINLEAALTAFHTDYGVYPDDEGADNPVLRMLGTEADFNEDGSPKPINGKYRMRHLCPPDSIANRRKARSYFNLRDDDLDPAGTGVLISPLGGPFWYEENASESPKPAGAKDPYKYDIWTHDSDTLGMNGPPSTFKKGPSETSINNWR